MRFKYAEQDLAVYGHDVNADILAMKQKVSQEYEAFTHTLNDWAALKEQELQAKKAVVADGNLSGKTFLFTGTLPTLKRSDAEAMVEKNGGKITGSVSSKLNYLVVGEDAGSKLEKARKINSVKIISEAEFLKMLG